MKTIMTWLAAASLLAAPAIAEQAKYTITDLGPVGTPFASPQGLNNSGLSAGVVVESDFNQHAVLWYKGQVFDISQPGLGGPNSGAFGLNASGLVLLQAEGAADPNNENFCGYFTAFTCRPALWQNSVITPLPLLGGYNGVVGNAVNGRGEAVGAAETSIRDMDCPSAPFVNGDGPLKYDFEAVVWGPHIGQIRVLQPLPGDTVGMAFGINDNGQAAGMSGLCSNTILPGFAAAPHAVLWDADGTAHDLGNLGGNVDTAVLGAGNAALAINNRGDVTGSSSLPDNATHHPFLWTKKTGMQDLGVLPGDNIGGGLGINNQGDVVGASVNGPDPLNGISHAALWRNGEIFDLNTLALPGAPLYLITACAINDAGEIVGIGVTTDGSLHGYIATPVN
jgi:probable HAF family extracellular repeat protein